MGIRQARPPAGEVTSAPTIAADSGPLVDLLHDPLSAELPMVALPSAFKPSQFKQATRARGARPDVLKTLDDHLSAIDDSRDPRERFTHLKSLQTDVDGFMLRYTQDNDRRRTVERLKTWVDGAITLRADAFAKTSQ